MIVHRLFNLKKFFLRKKKKKLDAAAAVPSEFC